MCHFQILNNNNRFFILKETWQGLHVCLCYLDKMVGYCHCTVLLKLKINIAKQMSLDSDFFIMLFPFSVSSRQVNSFRWITHCSEEQGSCFCSASLCFLLFQLAFISVLYTGIQEYWRNLFSTQLSSGEFCFPLETYCFCMWKSLKHFLNSEECELNWSPHFTASDSCWSLLALLWTVLTLDYAVSLVDSLFPKNCCSS